MQTPVISPEARETAESPSHLDLASETSPRDLPPRSLGEISLLVVLRCAVKVMARRS